MLVDEGLLSVTKLQYYVQLFPLYVILSQEECDYFILLYWVVFYCIILYCTILYCPVLHCSTLPPAIYPFEVNNNNNNNNKNVPPKHKFILSS